MQKKVDHLVELCYNVCTVRNKELQMFKFIITVYLLDGTVSETTRHTKAGMENYLSACFAQGDMERYTVEERKI